MLRVLALVAALALAAPAAARPPRPVKIRFPRFTLSAFSNRELCVLVHLPRTTPLDVGTWEITHHAARGMSALHFLVYAYTGENLAGVAADAGRIVESRGCLDLGPADRDARQLVASGPSTRSRVTYPDGVALRLAPVPDAPGGAPAGVALLLDANWANAAPHKAAASTRLVLRPPKRGSVRRFAIPFGVRTPELGLSVPPGQLRSTESSTTALHALRPEVPAVDVWQAPNDSCVLFLSGQMHERGTLMAIDHLDPGGQALNPADGPPNPYEPGRRHLFISPDYTDEGTAKPSPLLVRGGETLHPACWHDNGTTNAVRLGCEETAGVPPGIPAGLPGGGRAKPCTVVRTASPECPASDAAYPGRAFTGACVVANLVAGTTPEDEVCGLTAVRYDAVLGAAADVACDVSSLPPLP